MAGERVNCAVEDDGIWSISRTCELLQRIHERIPATADVAIYLPHTAFLFGKLLKISGRVREIYYLEEGYTSANTALLSQYCAPTPLDEAALVAALDAASLVDAWRIDRRRLAHLNEIPESALDARCEKYAGAFACSDDAFLGMAGVNRLPLVVAPRETPAQLLSFWGISNRYCDTRQIDPACRMVCEIIDVMLHENKSGLPMLVKLHPRDRKGLPAWFYERLRQRGVDYFAYCQRRAINTNIEPALLNFAHYHIFGRTAQAKYVSAFLGAPRMTQYGSAE
ncbi:hypothetical protein HCX48_13225 [Rhodocyclus tenuis]|uniref:Uncharacterized protein n=2 Tax=Rhodocyclus gracilis TaxID=2929842 RepID=A0ABX0WKD2_9RHOO|nr:hypothetical protein [Rhodocyclus gracilis]NJA90176.1 hypothetical protein [Rhodocyclus gracilis]